MRLNTVLYIKCEEELKQVENFTYLGESSQINQLALTTSKEGLAYIWSYMGRMQKDKKSLQKPNRTILGADIDFIYCYIWLWILDTQEERDEHRLLVFEMSCLRRILGILGVSRRDKKYIN